MTFHLLNVSVNVNDSQLPNDLDNEIESIVELVSLMFFDAEGALPDNPMDDEHQTVVGTINITWFMNSTPLVAPAPEVDPIDLPTDEALPISRPLFYTNPSYSIDTPPPKVA